MKSTRSFALIALAGVLSVAAACTPTKPLVGDAYWQRIDESSALYMTGPKAQQRLEQDIAGCVREIDELVKLNAIRETTPPDTHSEYRRALDASGDLSYYDTPTRMGSLMVDHSDYHDFESCMRAEGWERNRYVRYEPAMNAEKTYKDTKELRKWGVTGEAAKEARRRQVQELNAPYKDLNN